MLKKYDIILSVSFDMYHRFIVGLLLELDFLFIFILPDSMKSTANSNNLLVLVVPYRIAGPVV